MKDAFDTKSKQDLCGILFKLFGSSQFVDNWWNSPNIDFNFKTPLQIWDSNYQDRSELICYVLRFESNE